MTTTELELIVFDLDGTLIDSAPSILSCFGKVLEEMRIAPRVPLEERLIGPPLAQTLSTLTGIEDAAMLTSMAEAFKRHYDTSGYRESMPYPDVVEILHDLKARGYRLALATNKRIHPTQLILEHLGWSGLFSMVAALDSFQPKLPHKQAMLGAVLQQEGTEPALTIYVGDKIEDAQAAEANGMRFAAACWGYGSFNDAPAHWAVMQHPSQLTTLVEPVKE